MKKNSFDLDRKSMWCPGCGNFGILTAMKKAFEGLDLKPRDVLIVAGIGQAGKTPHYINCNMIHGLHGRALPLATGAKLANHNLNIIVSSGDGDCYGEGGNHFLAAIRRDIDITLLVHNNQVYGLTKGQASPTSMMGMKTKIQAGGTISYAFNPVAAALVTGARFVARGFAGNPKQLSTLIQAAMKHKGFAMIDIYQPCVSFNKINTHLWYKERVYDIADSEHDASDYESALQVAHMGMDKIPTGVIYQAEGTSFHERLDVLKKSSLFDYGFAKSQMNDILCQA